MPKKAAAILNEIIECETFENAWDPVFEVYTVQLPSLRVFLKEATQVVSLDLQHVLSALIYIDRYAMSRAITRTSIHAILFTSCLIALKYFEEHAVKRSYYAYLLGVKIDSLNEMENSFLEAIDYRLFISENEFNQYAKVIC